MISAEDSNYNRFDCGNKKSLSDPKIREELLAFHKKWYSSNIMTLCIQGAHSLTAMEQWVTDKFSPVLNHNVVVPDLGLPASYPKTHLSKIVKFVPVKDKDILNLMFVMPYSEREHQS